MSIWSTRRFHYAGDCTNLDGDLINEMKDGARCVTRRTFMKYCLGVDAIAQNLGYDRHPSQGLTMAGDAHITYHAGRYAGVAVYYFRWSGFEFVFSAEPLQPPMKLPGRTPRRV